MPLDKAKNETWNNNHSLIEEKFWEIYANTEKIPSIKQLSDASGFSLKTVYSHYYEMDVTEITEKYKIHLDRAMGALSKKAEDGDVFAIKLLAQLCGWTEKKKTELDIKQKTLKVEFTE